MNEYKSWGRTETGIVFHSFKGDGVGVCRSNVKAGFTFYRDGGLTEVELDTCLKNDPHLFRKCASCAKKEAAHRNRAEASMAPVGEYDQVCEGVTGYGDAAPSVEPTDRRERAAAALVALSGRVMDAAVEAVAERQAARRAQAVKPVDATCNACNWRMSSEGICMNCRWNNGWAEHKTDADREQPMDPQTQADQALAYAMAVGAPGVPRVGDSFNRTHDTFRKGYREEVETSVIVLELVTDCRDAWTGQTFPLAIRFQMTREGRNSYHTLPVDQFRDTWMN